MRKSAVISGAMLALLSRAHKNNPIVPKEAPERMDMNTPYEIRAAYRVFLDGKELVNCCVEADRVQGYVVKYVMERGRPKVIHKTYGDEFETERVQGKVEFKRR